MTSSGIDRAVTMKFIINGLDSLVGKKNFASEEERGETSSSSGSDSHEVEDKNENTREETSSSQEHEISPKGEEIHEEDLTLESLEDIFVQDSEEEEEEDILPEASNHVIHRSTRTKFPTKRYNNQVVAHPSSLFSCTSSKRASSFPEQD